MSIMKLNPPIRRGGIEVTTINEVARTVHFIVHVMATPEDAQTLEFKATLSRRTIAMVRYLETEGFIVPKQKWITHMGVVLHPPDETNFQTA